MTRVKTLLSVAGLAPLAACVNLAPGYSPADPPIPAELPAYGDPASEAVLLDWQTLITSPELAGLIRQALDQNRNLEATAANVRAARASLMVSRSALLVDESAPRGQRLLGEPGSWRSARRPMRRSSSAAAAGAFVIGLVTMSAPSMSARRR